MHEIQWVLCPMCHNKTRLKIRGDTVLINFPLYCPKCKQETLEKFKIRKLYLTLLIIAIPLLPCGIIFLFIKDTQINYAILLLSFAIIQISACVFSVFALSIIQQLTPDNMIGKVMAYTATFSLCAQPLGQIIFGILFDGFSSAVYLVLIPTGIILSIISLATKEFFLKIENLID